MARRAQQADQTRRRIITALIALVGEHAAAPDQVSVPEIAERAGVSVPTVYRHFGTKDALFAAIASVEFEEFSGTAERPSLANLPATLRFMFRQLRRHEGFVRATLTQQFGREVRRRREPDRAAMVWGLIEPAADRLRDGERAALGLLVRMLTSAPAFLYLSDKGGYDPDDAAALAAWAVRTLVTGAREHPPPGTGAGAAPDRDDHLGGPA